MIELKELVREMGGGNSGGTPGCFGGGTGDSMDLTSTLDTDVAEPPDVERGLPGRFTGTGGGAIWTGGVRGTPNVAA